MYLTGYNPTIERASGVIAQEGVPAVVGGPEAGVMAKEASEESGVDVYFAQEFAIPDEYYEGADFVSIKEILERVLGGKSLRRFAWLTSLELIPQQLAQLVRGILGREVEFVDASDILEELRYNKSTTELELMKQANLIAETAIRGMLAVLEPGLLESQVAAVGDFIVKSLGGDGYGVETAVNSGPRVRTIIGPASNREIKQKEVVQLGISPGFQCYKGVCRRAVVMGEPNELQKQYFHHLQEGYRRAKAALKKVVEKDLKAKYVDLAAREYFRGVELAGENMANFHTYSTAHGTGLTECLEPMVVGPDTEEKYANRVGIMLDLGVYNHPHPDIPGGCIEDPYFKDGNRLIEISSLPADVQELVGRAD